MFSNTALHNHRRTMRHLIALGLAAIVFAMSSQAAALDAYKDRRGLFVGLGVGGGAGSVSTDAPGEFTGLDQNYELGLHLNGIVGGGWTRNIIFGAEFNWWIRNVQVGERQLDHQHMSFNAVTNVFLLGPLYLQAGAGLAYAVFDTFRAGDQTTEYREMGLALKGGAGFEYFLNGTVAAGAQVGYTRHFYGGADFDTLAAGITLRWY
ncbi:MAG: outer membrane beta-barrel protein [Bradymonadaceae bacterium]|nr:outer membrane beta-barrel protein [Lujinxingiaceae bacterium]